DILDARGSFGGGRSFGGGGRSFGGSRSISKPSAPSTAKPPSSFGGNRSMTSNPSTQRLGSSFGGNRLGSHAEYTQTYGIPRKTQSFTKNNEQGISQNYRMNDYGGYGSGLMTGYMMGTSSWMWSMPFHPAFYYSRPYYVTNPDGTVDVYPPTFSWSKLIFTILILAVVVYIIYAIVRSVRRNKYGTGSTSSFS
ncbi:MAG: hypothetical protein ABSG15_11030, partial [FCB group bacterium]